MKITKLFGIVIGLHVGVIALLLVQPGCTTTTPPTVNHTQKETMALMDQESGGLIDAVRLEDGLDSAFNAGLEEERFAPTRPEEDFTSSDYEPLEPMTQTAETQVVEIAEESFTTHTVVSGDSLWKISRNYSVDLDDLIAANGLERNAVLQIGQQIQVPVEGSQATVSTVTPDAYQPTTLASGATRYTVQAGDTLSAIARKKGVPLSQVKAANNLSSDVIRVGQELILPEGTAPIAMAPSGATYTVQSGDYPSTIAKRYGMTTSELMALNGITDPRTLQVGRVLRVSGSASASPVPTTLPEPAVDAEVPAAAPEPVVLPTASEGPVEIREVATEPVLMEPSAPEEPEPELDFDSTVKVPVTRMQE